MFKNFTHWQNNHMFIINIYYPILAVKIKTFENFQEILRQKIYIRNEHVTFFCLFCEYLIITFISNNLLLFRINVWSGVSQWCWHYFFWNNNMNEVNKKSLKYNLSGTHSVIKFIEYWVVRSKKSSIHFIPYKMYRAADKGEWLVNY